MMAISTKKKGFEIRLNGLVVDLTRCIIILLSYILTFTYWLECDLKLTILHKEKMQRHRHLDTLDVVSRKYLVYLKLQYMLGHLK